LPICCQFKNKAKASDSYIARLTGKPDQTGFTIIEVELIGKSQWCCSTKWGRPLHVLTNNWTRSKQLANTPSPQSTTPVMVALKIFSRLFPLRTFKMMVPLILLQIQLAIICFWSWRGVEAHWNE